MLTPLRRYLREQRPSVAVAAAALRSVFAVIFLGQLAVAGLVALVVALVSSPPAGNPVLGPVLVVLALAQLPLVVFLVQRALRMPNKGSSLSATIFAGVLLSSPGWFIAFALVSRVGSRTLLLLLAFLAGYYGVGFAFAGRLARSGVQSAHREDGG